MAVTNLPSSFPGDVGPNGDTKLANLFGNHVKRKLLKGEPVWGAGLGVPSEWAAKILADVGLDFLWIDTEHSTFGLDAITMLPVIARMKNCMPMIRIATLDQGLIKRALDLGAGAIMIPQVNNPEEAQLAVRYAKYPPIGYRGVSPIWTSFLDISLETYLPAANDDICVVVQVETAEGVRNIEAIAEVEGVDVVFAGPSDLSASMGVIGQTNHPVVLRLLEEFAARVLVTGKVAGIAVNDVNQALTAFSQGYRFISFGNLLRAGAQSLGSGLQQLKSLAISQNVLP